jgi:hypothetical protein
MGAQLVVQAWLGDISVTAGLDQERFGKIRLPFRVGWTILFETSFTYFERGNQILIQMLEELGH